MYFAGIDIGSTMTKVAIVGLDSRVVSTIKGPTGPDHRQLARGVFQMAMEQARLDLKDISYVVATGYGRLNVPFADRLVTELTCQARGVFSLFPYVRTAIDIGGQDVKCMKILDGKLLEFFMNDKCAAGTGRFLEIVADTLGFKVEDIGDISLRSTRRIQISNLCTIFAQQEINSALSRGEAAEDILAGLHEALVSRVSGLVRRLKIEPDVVFTGGVAKNVGIVKAMEENLGCKLLIPDEPLLTGALGAAILAKELASEIIARGEKVSTKPRRLENGSFFI